MYRKSYKDEHKQNQFTLTQKLNFVAKSFKISIGINIAKILRLKNSLFSYFISNAIIFQSIFKT